MHCSFDYVRTVSWYGVGISVEQNSNPFKNVNTQRASVIIKGGFRTDKPFRRGGDVAASKERPSRSTTSCFRI